MERFPFYVEEFDRTPPFSPEQREAHVSTIRLRRKSGTVEQVLENEEFIRSLYTTLLRWGIGSRGSQLIPFGKFLAALRKRADELSRLDGDKLDENLQVEVATVRLWKLVETLGIVVNKNPLVAGSKCLHHLLPDLVPPMDREYTQTFFGWANPEFQNHPKECFEHAFRQFWEIAKVVKPEGYIGDKWRSSGPKILDNAVVAFCRVNCLESSNKKYRRRQQELIQIGRDYLAGMKNGRNSDLEI